MNCWKTINLQKQYGMQRLFIISSLTMLITFLFLYVPFTAYFSQNRLNDNYFSLFLLCIAITYPAHKLLHYLPMIPLGKKVKKIVYINYHFFPVIYFRAQEPIKKWNFVIASITPVIVLNAVFIGCCFLFTHYVHYFLILFAYHFGMCVPDFIRMKNLWKAPNQCFVEENEDGFEILINKAS
ncbi:DUF3267 domain-containing protein [Niallia sp. NCCP-28]|uniref:DUF3267 domain-containing protein n=1 Tax=Niallia sp. NCCP-28 TaxID=2934712 RepID=UPI00208A9692|nr:DUF3267 domain-containing protein [Niallia sp. NCCP-28]GKU81692.1 putative membrane protein YhaJ [Niallia sp. NCCP-28]